MASNNQREQGQSRQSQPFFNPAEMRSAALEPEKRSKCVINSCGANLASNPGKKVPLVCPACFKRYGQYRLLDDIKKRLARLRENLPHEDWKSLLDAAIIAVGKSGIPEAELPLAIANLNPVFGRIHSDTIASAINQAKVIVARRKEEDERFEAERKERLNAAIAAIVKHYEGFQLESDRPSEIAAKYLEANPKSEMSHGLLMRAADAALSGVLAKKVAEYRERIERNRTTLAELISREQAAAMRGVTKARPGRKSRLVQGLVAGRHLSSVA